MIKSNPFFIGEKATDARLDFNITRDIDFIQSDLVYTTGILYTLQPLINNPMVESKYFLGRKSWSCQIQFRILSPQRFKSLRKSDRCLV